MSSSVTSKFKKGDKVIRVGDTSAEGVEFGKVYTVENPSSHKGFYCGEIHNHVTLEEVDSTPSDKYLDLYIEKSNYREMKPTDLIKISINGNESEVPLGDLVHATELLGVTNGWYGARLWKALNGSLGEDGFTEDMETSIEFRDKQKETLDYFFKPYYDKQQQEKEDLMKDIELQKEVLDNQKKLLKSLEDKLSQM